MDQFWLAVSTNVDRDGLQYISTIEAREFPFIGTQFHPEKNVFEWAEGSVSAIPHSGPAVATSLYLARHLVRLARASRHAFPDSETEEAALIYNYSPQYVGRAGGSTVQQNYFF